ncbi:MAG: TetR/AcrR family transcriptional regulator [Aurantimonas coralicida]
MKEQIEELSVEMLIRHGYQGFRFRDIADRLGTTRAAIHYYYGNKQNLCEIVVVKYIANLLAKWERNWAGEKPFTDKIIGMMEANRERYVLFNETYTSTNSWSLICRMRVDRDLIGPKAQEALHSFAVTLERFIIAAIDQAVDRGELVADIPKRDVALQLVAIADSAGAITQDDGGFERLNQLYRSFAHIVEHAYGCERARAEQRPVAQIATKH